MSALLLALACTGPVVPVRWDSAEPEVDLTAHVFDPDRVLRVDLVLAGADWDELRMQTRTFEGTIGREDCQEEPFENPFTWFEASATLDGQLLERVDVRKKGFLGSMSFDKPSLKLDLGEYVEGQTFSGVRRLTLNNSISDPSYLRQCLSYAWFADVGVPSPRCSLARVSVNGVDLGLFVNLEGIKGPMLERHFEHGDNNLYEGTLADFREGWTGTIEKKNNASEDDWSDVERLTAAASVPDDRLLDELDAAMDLDQFLTYWAAEVLIEHGDGYASNTNNWYVYADPEDGRFDWLPWGTDGVLYGNSGAVYATAWIPNRLMQLDEGRALYRSALKASLEVWDEDLHTQRAEGMSALIEQELSGDELAEVQAAGRDVMAEIQARRGHIEQGLEGSLSWPYAPRDDFCLVPEGSFQATFSTDWGSLNIQDPWSYGQSSMSLALEDGVTPTRVEGSAVAGITEGQAVMYLPAWLSETEAILVYTALPEEAFQPGHVQLDLGESIGALFYLDTATMEDFQFVAYIVGDLEFIQAGSSSGDPIEGTLEAAFMSF